MTDELLDSHALARVVRDLLWANRSSHGLSMGAIALPIVAGPTAMPIPSSEASLPEPSSFGVLVAAFAKGEHSQAAGPSETPDDRETTPPDVPSDIPPAFAVREWLAQAEAPPALSKGLSYVLERFDGDTKNGVRSKSSAPTDFELGDALESDSTTPLPSEAQVAIESKTHPTGKTERTESPVPEHDGSKPPAIEPSVFLSLTVPAAPPSEASQPGASAFGSNAFDERSHKGDGNPALGADSASSARPPLPASGNPSIESTVAARFDSRRAPIGESPKTPAKDAASETNAAASRQSAAAHAVDDPKHAEPNNISPPSARAPESHPQFAAHTQAVAQTNISAQMPDGSGLAAPTTSVTAADSGVEQPVKLSLATRAGQQTQEVQTLALHIAARSTRGDSRFTIRLDPPELGRIDVNLSVNSHGHAQAVLAVEKPQTLELLLRDAPTLERALKDAGLELGSNLSFLLKEEGGSHFARDEHDSRPPRTLELVPAEAANRRPVVNASLADHLYGLHIAQLDITV